MAALETFHLIARAARDICLAPGQTETISHFVGDVPQTYSVINLVEARAQTLLRDASANGASGFESQGTLPRVGVPNALALILDRKLA